MNKYYIAKENLEKKGFTEMTCYGNSMQPIFGRKERLLFKKQSDYEIGDCVFCKVNGRFIDAHKIIKKEGKRYLIANNHGHENGWTRQVFGKVIKMLDRESR